MTRRRKTCHNKKCVKKGKHYTRKHKYSKYIYAKKGGCGGKQTLSLFS